MPVRRLAEAGHRVVLDIRRARIDAIERDGRVLELIAPFTEAQHSAIAPATARGWLGPDAWVITLQNGIGVADELRARVTDRTERHGGRRGGCGAEPGCDPAWPGAGHRRAVALVRTREPVA